MSVFFLGFAFVLLLQLSVYIQCFFGARCFEILLFLGIHVDHLFLVCFSFFVAYFSLVFCFVHSVLVVYMHCLYAFSSR